ncbi:hypothetical protein [Chitinophaga sp. 212800008-4]|uniref:hypothetical protein n=1 Tax=unclassified Chitinophaga TaxID=2619133 RepID=UPI0030D1FD6D
MRWLMILLSLYVLTLSAIPCCGDDQCCEEMAGKETHHNHHRQELPCSPFFSCNTCHGVVVPDFTPGLSARVIILSSFSFNYIACSLPGFTASVWQPPRLA